MRKIRRMPHRYSRPSPRSKTLTPTSRSILKTVALLRYAYSCIPTPICHSLFQVAFKVPSLVLTFVITCSIDSQNKATFTVECTGNMPLFSAISRCLASRPRPNDLAYLLDMIAAYTNTRTAKCVKCGKLLDNSALSPAARRSKQTTNGDGSTLTTWEPLHEGCL